MDAGWRDRLNEMATEESDALLLALPADIREQLAELPVTFEWQPNDGMVQSGIHREATLGLFVGVPYSLALSVSQRLPPQIILFLGNIWRYAREDETLYRFQVRKTLMHEIGHYLGLNEDELGVRNLR